MIVRDTRTILVTNPGADLYGSDRMALETVSALLTRGFHVTVAVPSPGPLIELLTKAGAARICSQKPAAALRPKRCGSRMSNQSPPASAARPKISVPMGRLLPARRSNSREMPPLR